MEGAGAALLLSPGYIWTQLSRTHLDLYHRLLPINTVVRALAVDVAVLWLAAALATGWLERMAGGRWTGGEQGRGSLAGLVWALWLGLLASRIVAGLIVAQVLDWQELSAGRVFAVAAGLLAVLWALTPRGYGLLVRGLRFVILLLGFSMVWALPTLVAAGFAQQPHDRAAFQRAVASTQHQRVVWLLFDEMSYNQAFDHRWPGLQLPHFDRLRGESVTFSDMQPDGYFTDHVIPSLFLGRPMADIRSTEAGVLLYQTARGGTWAAFDGSATIFADAQRRGWTTGVSGEFNPYCRMLENQLDWCWMQLDPFGDHLSRDKTTWQNVASPAEAMWARARHQRFERVFSVADDYDDMMKAGRELAADENIDFAFVHLYLPHPPGYYDRKTGRVGTGGSYIDNLALADRALGEMMEAIEQTGRAGTTTLVISSDHSWRVGIWRHAFGWTKEDELASEHGRFDPRPVLMVHFPGEDSGAPFGHAVPLLAMHGMLEGILAGQIGDAQQLEAWAARQ